MPVGEKLIAEPFPSNQTAIKKVSVLQVRDFQPRGFHLAARFIRAYRSLEGDTEIWLREKRRLGRDLFLHLTHLRDRKQIKVWLSIIRSLLAIHYIPVYSRDPYNPVCIGTDLSKVRQDFGGES